MVAYPDPSPETPPSPSPDLTDPFHTKLRLLLEQGLLSSAYRVLCGLAPLGPTAPCTASPARRANVLALCGAVGTVELSLEHERWQEALDGIEVVDSLWKMADWLAGREGRAEEKCSREGKRCEWRCRALEGLHRWEDLVNCARDGNQLVPPCESAPSYLAVAHYQLGQLQESFEAASQICPGVNPTEHQDVMDKMRAALKLVKLGNDALFASNNLDLALEHYTEALKVDDTNVRIKLRLLRVRSTTYLRAGDPLAALDDVAKILELRPFDRDAFLTRARAYLALQNPREALVACAAARRYGNAGDGSSEKLGAEELLREKEEAAKAREEEAARQAKREADEARRAADEARRAADEAKRRARPERGSSTGPPPSSGATGSGGEGQRAPPRDDGQGPSAQGPSGHAAGGGAYGGGAGRGGPYAQGGYGGWQYGGGGGYGAGPPPGWNGGGWAGGGWHGPYGGGPHGAYGPGGWRPGPDPYGGWSGPGGGPGGRPGEEWRQGGWGQGQWQQGGWGSYGSWYSGGWQPPGGGRQGEWSGGPGAGPRWPPPPPPPPRSEKDDLAQDHYATLELDRAASTADIRAAFLRLSLVAHPDKGGTHELFIRLKAAYNVLVDPLARRRYDSGTL
ncbi:hypothetical protein JCM9279_004137 [Rhodotorula babjevae]